MGYRLEAEDAWVIGGGSIRMAEPYHGEACTLEHGGHGIIVLGVRARLGFPCCCQDPDYSFLDIRGSSRLRVDAYSEPHL